jgi:hypothetical protein
MTKVLVLGFVLIFASVLKADGKNTADTATQAKIVLAESQQRDKVPTSATRSKYGIKSWIVVSAVAVTGIVILVAVTESPWYQQKYGPHPTLTFFNF